MSNNYQPIVGKKVFVKDGEYIDKALRRFKKKIKDSGILQELRERECYEKPSMMRKRKKAAAANRQKKYQDSQKLSKSHITKSINKPKNYQQTH